MISKHLKILRKRVDLSKNISNRKLLSRMILTKVTLGKQYIFKMQKKERNLSTRDTKETPRKNI